MIFAPVHTDSKKRMKPRKSARRYEGCFSSVVGFSILKLRFEIMNQVREAKVKRMGETRKEKLFPSLGIRANAVQKDAPVPETS